VHALASYQELRDKAVLICRFVYDRELSDSAGGNLAVRADENRALVTPRYMGQRKRWRIEPGDLLLVDLNGQVLEGQGECSRELRMHLGVLREFALAGAVIHAHPKYLMAFAVAGRAMPTVIEHTKKFGTIPVADCGKSGSAELAEAVVAVLRPRASQLEQHGLACILPSHGVAVVGRNLDDAFDTLERLERNAVVLLLGGAVR
jgi:L-fuculose-phosphate aldolase